jgi:hypothetical protein
VVLSTEPGIEGVASLGSQGDVVEKRLNDPERGGPSMLTPPSWTFFSSGLSSSEGAPS